MGQVYLGWQAKSFEHGRSGAANFCCRVQERTHMLIPWVQLTQQRELSAVTTFIV